MNLSPRDRRAVLIGAATLLIVLAANYLLMPWIDSWSNAREQIAQDRRQLTHIQRQIRTVLWQRERLEQLYGPAVKEPLEDRQTAQLNLIKAVQDVFKSGGVKLSDYQPQRSRPLSEVPGVEVIPLQIRGKCNLSQLTKCLSAMQEGKMLMVVESFSIANNLKKPGELEISMTISTLAQQPEAKS